MGGNVTRTPPVGPGHIGWVAGMAEAAGTDLTDSRLGQTVVSLESGLRDNRCRPGGEVLRLSDVLFAEQLSPGSRRTGGTCRTGVVNAAVLSTMAPVSSDLMFSELMFSDDELAELALAADPNAAVADDAMPLRDYLGLGHHSGELLPQWYMPAPAGAGRLLQGWRRRVVLLVVASFVLLNAYGLCSTYGYVGFD